VDHFRPFQNRRHAGQVLAALLETYANRKDVIVLALPRGGVPVGFEVASALNAPLDVFVVRKLGVPGQEELAMGAIASGGILVLNDDVVNALQLSRETIERVARREEQELSRRERLYRGDRPAPAIESHVVILVDDGLATGSTMRAAAQALKRLDPARIVVAVPVAPADTCAELRQDVDEVVCAETPQPFHAVGLCYEEFPQTSDEEVREILKSSNPYG
jgi:putative phosphoribosyl transferase